MSKLFFSPYDLVIFRELHQQYKKKEFAERIGVKGLQNSISI